MRVIWLLIQLVFAIIMLPFRLLDLVFIGLPRELYAKRWRKSAKVGDSAYFINIMGTKTVGIITKMHDDGEVCFVSTSIHGSSSQSMPLADLYPIRSGN